MCIDMVSLPNVSRYGDISCISNIDQTVAVRGGQGVQGSIIFHNIMEMDLGIK